MLDWRRPQGKAKKEERGSVLPLRLIDRLKLLLVMVMVVMERLRQALASPRLLE